jgi:hypothetical protein
VSAEVVVDCGLALRAFVGGGATAAVRFDPAAKRWVFPEVVGFYAPPGEDRPVRPDFPFGFPTPALQFDPPVLAVTEAYSHDGGLSWTFKAAKPAATSLEAFFGPDLAAGEGIVKVTLRAGRGDGTWDAATVSYELRPQLRLVAWGYDKQPARRSGRTCRGIALREGELVADGVDRQPLAAVFLRTDQAVPPGGEWAARSPHGEVAETRLEGRAASAFVVEPLPSDDAGATLVGVRAARPLLLTPQRSRDAPSVRFVPGLARSAPPHYELASPAVEPIALRPRYVFLKLWVVPGGMPGTSEAAAFACVAPHAGLPLPGLPLELGAAGGGSCSLTVEGASRVTTDAHGLARWRLRYAGLAWSSLPAASWRVRCGAPDPRGEIAEATEVPVDVAANVASLLADAHDQRASAALDLENPELSLAGHGRLRACLDYAVPDFLSGPALNLAVSVGESLPAADARALAAARQRYVCGSLSMRLFDWMAHRRFGAGPMDDPDDRARMNGVEIDQYAMYFLGPVTHHFAGVYLSGTAPDDSPRFLDPWWRQSWDDPSNRTPDGLLTAAGETGRGIAAVSMVAALVVVAAKVLVVLAPSLGVLPAIRMLKIWLASHAAAIGDLAVFHDSAQTNQQNGVYARYCGSWPEQAADRLRRVHPAVTAVAPLVPWGKP